MKVSELSGAKLDYWVYRALHGKHLADFTGGTVPFSTDGRWGMPIIEHEGITIEPNPYGLKLWAACSGPGPRDAEPFWIWKDGATPLIAAMRCFIASKFGEEVPNE